MNLYLFLSFLNEKIKIFIENSFLSTSEKLISSVHITLNSKNDMKYRKMEDLLKLKNGREDEFLQILIKK